VKKTRQVLEELQKNYHQLFSAIRGGKVRAPTTRDASGDYLWSEGDISAARAALAVDRRCGPRPRKAVSSS
jgi:hypothetical protein